MLCSTWHLSSLTRDRTCVPCIARFARWSLNHWTTTEVPLFLSFCEDILSFLSVSPPLTERPRLCVTPLHPRVPSSGLRGHSQDGSGLKCSSSPERRLWPSHTPTDPDAGCVSPRLTAVEDRRGGPGPAPPGGRREPTDLPRRQQRHQHFPLVPRRAAAGDWGLGVL